LECHTLMIVCSSDVLPDCHADFDQRVAVDTTALAWESSPSGTVWRKPLYRMGGEHGPVTSLVRYAPGGSFRSHFHPEGEEILVLARGCSPTSTATIQLAPICSTPMVATIRLAMVATIRLAPIPAVFYSYACVSIWGRIVHGWFWIPPPANGGPARRPVS